MYGVHKNNLHGENVNNIFNETLIKFVYCKFVIITLHVYISVSFT